ncbi:DNA ligase-associated putative exonuclease [Paraburkholderia sp. WSM4174]
MDQSSRQTNTAPQANDLVIARPEGLYCPPGDFYIDPWRPVERAVITHAHSDHARFGHQRYLATRAGASVLLSRLPGIALHTLDYGEPLTIGAARVSLHPAGHVLGSAQVRIEHAGRVWVASGDYKLEADPTCAAFEPVRCDTFITESTFGLPIYRWDTPQSVFDSIDSWWRHNASEGRASVLFCYSFGKAQRVLASVDAAIGPIFCHGALEPLNRAYRDAGVRLPALGLVGEIAAKDKGVFKQALIVAPALRAEQRVAQALRRLQRCVRVGLDAPARRASPARRRSWLRAVGSRGLAGFANGDTRERRLARDRHAWLDRTDGALAQRAGPARQRVRNAIRRRYRRSRRGRRRRSAGGERIMTGTV